MYACAHIHAWAFELCACVYMALSHFNIVICLHHSVDLCRCLAQDLVDLAAQRSAIKRTHTCLPFYIVVVVHTKEDFLRSSKHSSSRIWRSTAGEVWADIGRDCVRDP